MKSRLDGYPKWILLIACLTILSGCGDSAKLKAALEANAEYQRQIAVLERENEELREMLARQPDQQEESRATLQRMLR